jgi:hypothetical protein
MPTVHETRPITLPLNISALKVSLSDLASEEEQAVPFVVVR